MRTLFLFIGCLFAVWCFAITDAYCTEDFWERDTLIMGGSPSSLSIAYDSRVMLALHTGTAYLSTDYGDIWQRLNFPARVIAVSASYSEYIYIATTDSLYYSVDLGRTWKTLAVPFVTNKFYSDIDNRWRKNTYASLCSVYPQQISIFINTTLRYEPQDSLTTSIYSTNNNGATWDSLMFLPLFTPKITFNKDYGTALLTGWRFGKQTMSGIQGIVMCSKDSAKTWQLLTDTLPSYLGSAIMLDKNIYMTTVQEKGIFKSIDSGNTWKSVSSPVQTVWSLAWHKGQLLAGTAENLYISSDTGRTWIISDATPKIFSLASIISNHDAVFILSYTGVFRDKAFPSVFEDIDKQFIAGSIRSASWFDRSTMLVCYNGGASITTDMGKSWRKTGLVSYFVSLVGISSKKTLFVATSNRFDNQLSNKITSFFMRSTDNGATWHEVYGIKSNGNTYPIYPDCFLAVGDT
ncbi:MAG: hypothetical protein LC116_05570, partial [Bacteroidetes bacterium]|nr:hypothetical protein [Bacteroidota bacterium]